MTDICLWANQMVHASCKMNLFIVIKKRKKKKKRKGKKEANKIRSVLTAKALKTSRRQGAERSNFKSNTDSRAESDAS